MERRDIVRSAVRSAVRSPIRTARSGITDFLSSLPKLLHIEAESPYVLKTGGAEAGYVDGAAFVKNQDGDRLPYDGVGYAYLSGVIGNYLSTTTSVDYSSDLDIIWEGSPDWQTGSSLGRLAGRMLDGNNMSFRMALLGAGRLEFAIFPTGLGSSVVVHGPVTPVPFADFEFGRIRATFSSSTMTLYYSTDPYGTPDEDLIWVSLGSLVTIYPTMFLSTGNVNIGTDFDISNNPLKGQFKRAIFKTGGVPFIDIDIHRDADHLDTSFICGTGQTVSVIGSGSSPARIIKATGELKVTGFVQTTAASQPTYLPYDGVGYAHFGSGRSNNITTPSTEPLKLLGDFEIEAKLRLSNWTSFADSRCICAKLGSAFNRAYVAYVSSLGALQLQISVDGLDTQTFQSSVIVPFTPNQEGYVKFVVDDDNGSSQRVVTFYTSLDGSSWTQLGSPVSRLREGNMFSDNTSPLEIGNSGSGAALTWMSGAIYYVKMRDGINGNVIFDCNIDADATDNATSFTSTSGHPMTVNRSGNNPATIIKKARIRGDGVDDSLLVAPVMPPMTTKNTIAWHGSVLNLASQSTHPLTEVKGGGNRFLLRMLQNGSLSAYLSNGTSSPSINAPATNPVVNGQIFTYIFVWDGTSVNLYLDGELYYSTTTISVIPNTTPSQASIFAKDSGSTPSALDCMSCIHFPKALTPTEVAKLHTQLING